MTTTVEQLWHLHRRGLSYASDKPAVNLLLADLANGCGNAADTITSLMSERDRLRDEWRELDRIITEVYVVNDQPDRILIDGVWYDGPPATAYLKMLRLMQQVARAALTIGGGDASQ